MIRTTVLRLNASLPRHQTIQECYRAAAMRLWRAVERKQRQQHPQKRQLQQLQQRPSHVSDQPLTNLERQNFVRRFPAPLGAKRYHDYSCPETVRAICHAAVPGWSTQPLQDVSVTKLNSGLSNVNYRVSMASPDVSVHCVLFRVYGKGMSVLYDNTKEFQIFKMLSKFQIAPRLYASDDEWRIEEWHDSIPLQTRSMCNPSILAQVAAQLGRLHKISSKADFPAELHAEQPLHLTRLERWGDAFSQIARHPRVANIVAKMGVREMLAEREWLAKFVVEGGSGTSTGLDVVFSHWDCQENNVLQAAYGLRLIDFEYSGMEHQAFDVANYFVECTIDYLEDKYPYYRICLHNFPTETEQRFFCSVYLSEYLGVTIRPEDAAVSVFLDRVQRFTLVSHLLWAFWSVVRAQQQTMDNGFDYLHWAQTRWFLYRQSKHALLQALPNRKK